MIILVCKFKIKYSKEYQIEFNKFLMKNQVLYHNNLDSTKFYIKFKKIINILEIFPEIFPILKIKNNVFCSIPTYLVSVRISIITGIKDKIVK